MRITDLQVTAQLIAQVNTAYTAMEQTQAELASGKQITTPADNPLGAAAVVTLQGQLAQNTQLTATASDTQGWLQSTESALAGVGSVLTQVRTLGVQAANGTITAQERQAIAASVGQLLQQGVDAANGTYGGRYVLAGTQTGTAPFVYAAGSGQVTYQGDSGQVQREITPGQLLTISTPGSTALSPAFTAMSRLLQDVQSGASSQISADLTSIDSAQSTLLASQATVGASINRVTAAQASLQSSNLALTTQQSGLQDVDMAQASIDFATQQTTYQAILAAAGKANQPTLLQFLQ